MFNLTKGLEGSEGLERLGDLKRSKSKKRAFSLFDTMISMIIIAPLSIGFWRGLWECMDRHAEL